MADFADALGPEIFFGAHFKWWKVKAMLWLQDMKVLWVSSSMPEQNISKEDQRRFQETNGIFFGAVLDILVDYLVDAFLYITDAKALWGNLNATYGASRVQEEA